jgi:cellulose biosynthesis protein BcsQ
MITPIVVAATKGGVTKTMTVRSLADALSERGVRVLVFDADPQQSLTWAVGAEFGADPLGDDQLILINEETEFAWWLRRGGVGLKSAADGQLHNLFARLFATRDADVMLIDTGAFEPRIVRAAIDTLARIGRGMVLTPMRPSTDDLGGFAGIYTLVQEANFRPVHRGLLSDVEAVYRETREIRSRVHADYPGVFYDVEIPHDARARDATGWRRTSALTNNPGGRSRAACAYRKLAQILQTELGIPSSADRSAS